MNVLYDYQIFSRQRYGGISRYFYELIKYSLNEESLNISLFQGFHINSNNMRSLIKNPNLYFGLRHKKILPTLLLSKLNKFLFKLLIRSKNTSFDIYHPTYYDYTNIIDIKSRRTVITVHDMIHEKFPQYLKGANVITDMKKKCVEAADKIITISENTKRDLVEYFKISQDKIEVTYLAASDVFRTTTTEENNAFLKYHQIHNPFILYVGERVGYKNFMTLLNSYSRWTHKQYFDLFCIGGKNQWSKDEAMTIRNNNLENSVKLFANITDEELCLFYSNAFVYVIPSLYEGFGIMPLEAMACGTPVIAANTSSIPEVVGAAGLFFVPSSSDELIDCLDNIVDNDHLREELMVKGLERSKNFSWRKTASKTFDIYQIILS